MKRMSRRGINNIVMFAAGAMIIVLTLLNREMNAPEPTAEPNAPVQVLPANAVILMLDYPAVRFERTGPQWRQQGGQQRRWPVAPLAAAWRQLQAPVETRYAVPGTPDVVVKVLLAGDAQPRRFLFFTQQDSVLLMVGDQAWRLTPEQYDSLVPTTLLP